MVTKLHVSNSKIKILFFISYFFIYFSKIPEVFIAEKGPECFQEKADAIKECANSTFSKYMPTDTPSLDNLPKFVFGEKECG
jgi:hypothetical protein